MTWRIFLASVYLVCVNRNTTCFTYFAAFKARAANAQAYCMPGLVCSLLTLTVYAWTVGLPETI